MVLGVKQKHSYRSSSDITGGGGDQGEVVVGQIDRRVQPVFRACALGGLNSESCGPLG